MLISIVGISFLSGLMRPTADGGRSLKGCGSRGCGARPLVRKTIVYFSFSPLFFVVFIFMGSLSLKRGWCYQKMTLSGGTSYNHLMVTRVSKESIKIWPPYLCWIISKFFVGHLARISVLSLTDTESLKSQLITPEKKVTPAVSFTCRHKDNQQTKHVGKEQESI